MEIADMKAKTGTVIQYTSRPHQVDHLFTPGICHQYTGKTLQAFSTCRGPDIIVFVCNNFDLKPSFQPQSSRLKSCMLTSCLHGCLSGCCNGLASNMFNIQREAMQYFVAALK